MLSHPCNLLTRPLIVNDIDDGADRLNWHIMFRRALPRLSRMNEPVYNPSPVNRPMMDGNPISRETSKNPSSRPISGRCYRQSIARH
jgi:hypothetical protein